MVHLWVRAEERPNERRVGLMPEGATALLAKGMRVTVEESPDRTVPAAAYAAAGATLAPRGSWRDAPADAWILGLKELPDDGSPLRHRHIMFGHAFKGQAAGPALLARFEAGGGALYDLEYLLDGNGRRVVAFGYWAGYVGAAVTLAAWAAQAQGEFCGPVTAWEDQGALIAWLRAALGEGRPDVLIVGAKGRVGTGAGDLCDAMGLATTRWDMEETAHGGPFPEVLAHGVFLNAVVARPGTPVFVPAEAKDRPRALRVIGDISCDPGTPYSPVRVYDRVTDWEAPARRVADAPPLDVMAIDNLPSLLPRESSEDFAAQLLPHLARLATPEADVWGRAHATYLTAIGPDP